MRLDDTLSRRPASPQSEGLRANGGTIDTTPDVTSKRTSQGNIAPSGEGIGGLAAKGDVALAHASNGYRVFPLKPGAKSPLTAHGHKDATDDPSQIRAWWRQWPEANIGIACGLSGVLGVDFDPKNNDRVYSDWYESELGQLKPSPKPTTKTPNQGEHHLWRDPYGLTGNPTSGLRGVDLRAGGGYLVAPGSELAGPDGFRRHWTNPEGGWELPPVSSLPEAPRKVTEVLSRPKARREASGPHTTGRASLAELLTDPPVAGGGRNNWLAQVAGHLARSHRGDRASYLAKVAEANLMCCPPLSDDERNKTAESIWGKEQAKTPGEKDEKKSAATLLVELAEASYRFGCTDDGSVFALRPGSHVVRTLTGDKRSLRAELSRTFFRTFGKAPAQQALADAQGVIEGMAQEQNPETVNLRVAQTDEAIWVDVGDQDEHVVKIAAGSWQVQESCPVLFSRTALTGALPTPTRGVPLDRLWGHLNVADRDRPMVLAWLVQALLQPGLPHPILALFGEQGTAKSTLTRRLVGLIDPSPVPVRKPPKDGEAWISAAQGSYVVGLDNLSSIPDWFSDSLCRAATGDGDIRRTLYKDKQLTVFAFRRAVLLNGIDVGALRGDLASRAVLVNLDRLATTRAEQAMEAEWQADYPGLVGALLTFAAKVAEVLPRVSVERPPRMADYAHVLAAVDQVLGTTGSTRYGDQEETLAEDAITANPFLAALTDRGKSFRGTGGELLALLEPRLDHWRKPQGWPATPRYVTTLLKRNAPALRKAGWRVEADEDRHQKVTVWDLTPPAEDSDELF